MEEVRSIPIDFLAILASLAFQFPNIPRRPSSVPMKPPRPYLRNLLQPAKKANVRRKESKQMDYKRLYRSNKDAMIAGVCGGLGEYFNLDPTVVRLLAILLLIVTGFFPVILIYIILSVVIPRNPTV
jgi:phage shock protein C